jgi:putative acetyltransferase
VTVRLDRPDAPDVRRLLDEHLADMFATSPAESVHALDHSALADPSITFWTARDADGALLGCGALRALAGANGGGADAAGAGGEIKSMRTGAAARGRGVATLLLATILEEARSRGYDAVWLETGAEDYFAAARRLYARSGFVECGPFGAYAEDHHSVFMTLDLRDP